MRRLLRAAGLLVDPGTWLEQEHLLACAYPRREAALRGLADQGVSVLINLHERPHDPSRIARYGLSEIHLPVRDFTAPTSEQLEAGVLAIEEALTSAKKVAVHCGGGLGRTGTLLACYLVRGGMSPDEAVVRVRSIRPGSIETRDQYAAVQAFARRGPRTVAGELEPAG